jgi:hypothetical protein
MRRAFTRVPPSNRVFSFPSWVRLWSRPPFIRIIPFRTGCCAELPRAGIGNAIRSALGGYPVRELDATSVSHQRPKNFLRVARQTPIRKNKF